MLLAAVFFAGWEGFLARGQWVNALSFFRCRTCVRSMCLLLKIRFDTCHSETGPSIIVSHRSEACTSGGGGKGA